MIPTMLLIGLGVGAFVHDRASLSRGAVIAAACAALWGAAVGVTAGSVATAAGGTGLALVNVVVGAALAAAVRAAGTRAVRPAAPR